MEPSSIKSSNLPGVATTMWGLAAMASSCISRSKFTFCHLCEGVITTTALNLSFFCTLSAPQHALRWDVMHKLKSHTLVVYFFAGLEKSPINSTDAGHLEDYCISGGSCHVLSCWEGTKKIESTLKVLDMQQAGPILRMSVPPCKASLRTFDSQGKDIKSCTIALESKA